MPHGATWTDEFPDRQNQVKDQQPPPIKVQPTTETTPVANAIKGGGCPIYLIRSKSP